MYETRIFLSQLYEVTSFVTALLEAEPRVAGIKLSNKMLYPSHDDIRPPRAPWGPLDSGLMPIFISQGSLFPYKI